MLESRYSSGEHLEKVPEWYVDESPWKIRHIVPMLKRHRLKPRSICEVGCGAGEVLRLLQMYLPEDCTLWGYDISPQAIALCQKRANQSLHFKLADIREEQDKFFDLMLVLDVIEHLEDYISFLRDIKSKSQYKLFHIPLEISVQSVLRGKVFQQNRDLHGHLHHFNREIALGALEDAGYTVLDYSYSPEYEMATTFFLTNLMKLPRKLLYSVNRDLAIRVLGGSRMLVLAK